MAADNNVNLPLGIIDDSSLKTETNTYPYVAELHCSNGELVNPTLHKCWLAQRKQVLTSSGSIGMIVQRA